jgi:zinc protease
MIAMRRQLEFFAFAAAVLLACGSVTRADGPPNGAAAKPQIPELKIEQYRLPNGLSVILHEDHHAPKVALYVVYKVGSKDEKPGKTGIAHLFEHLMFEGTEHSPERFSDLFADIGGDPNATTSEDQTIYFETFPKNGLELALWLESDRMGFLLPALTQEELDNEREIVRNERFEKTETAPYGRSDEAIRKAYYPQGHPYGRSVAGSLADLAALRIADLDAFYQRYYAPSNAVLCLVGDFRIDETKRLVKKYFSFTPVGRGAGRKEVQAIHYSLRAATQITITDRVTIPRLQLHWPTVPAYHADEAALDVLAAVLEGSASRDRLYRRLVQDQSLVRQVFAEHPTKLLAGSFEVWAYVLPDKKLDQVVAIIDSEIERIKRAGPAAEEILKAKVAREKDLVMSLESISGKASVLSQTAASLGDALGYRKVLEQVFAVTPADVQRVARQYLGPERLRVDIVPGVPAPAPGEVEPAAAKNEPLPPVPDEEIVDSLDRSVQPKLGPTPHSIPPHFERRNLKNGLELLIVERHGAPIVNFNLVIKSGESLVPKSKAGLGSLVIGLLAAGTKSRTERQIASDLADLGASFEARCAPDSCTAKLIVLSRNLARGLDVFADMILNPAFSETTLEKHKLEQAVDASSAADDVQENAESILRGLVYGPDHPYSRPNLGWAQSIQSITRDDVASFYGKTFVPRNAVLIVVGDVRADAMRAALEARFGGWAGGAAPESPSLPAPARATGRPLFMIDNPGAAQSVVLLGWPSMPAKSPDASAIMVMDQILGAPGGRIDINLREDKGYTYGLSTGFHLRKGAGMFHVRGPVPTRVTKEALAEIVKELSDLVGSAVPSKQEIAGAREPLIQAMLDSFDTDDEIADRLARMVTFELPDSEYATFQRRIEAVNREDVARVAKKTVRPEDATILVVGDQARIAGPLKTLPFVKSIRLLDAHGNAVPPAAQTTNARGGLPRANSTP